MMPWSKIVISAEDQTGPAFNSARNNVKGFSGDVAASTTQLQSWGQALLGGITVGAVAGKLVAVQREFDVLNSSLITVTGSSAAAEREMAWIKQFAKETPFGLAQATEGFVKMKALGLEPTRASLMSFANTSSAMGKDLMQMIEAVADASTGEFERLKDFGIKAKKQGDDVSLTFQGITTKIKNNAEEITKYLEAIGNNQFAGASTERTKTLDGAIGELSDTWDDLFRTVNQNATGTLIADTVRMATAAVSDLTEVLGAMTRGADDSARATGALTTIQNGLGTVFETVAVLGLNVKYVLVQIGNELGGLAAQAAAVATLQFSQAAEIGRMMKEDAAAARAQVDAGTARILNARQDANNRGSTLAGSANAGLDKYLAGMTTPPRPTRPASGGGGGGGGRAARPRAQTERESEEARAYAQAMEAIAKAQMTAAIAGENYTTTQQRLVDIMTSPEWRNMPEEWRLVIAQQGEAAILAEQHAAAQKKANDARKAEAEAATRELESLQSGNAQMREQIDMLGLTTAEQTAYTQALNESAIAKMEDKAASLEMLDADSAIAKQLREQVAALKDRNALLGRKAEKEQLLEAQRAQLDMWKSIDQTAHDVFVNIFEDGAGTFKRLGQTLKAAVLDMLYQMTVKRWIIQIGASFTGQPLSVVSQALGGGQGGIGGMISNGNSLLNLFTGNSGGIGSLLFGSSAAYGLGVPGVSLGSQQAAMLAAQTGQFGWGGLTSTASAANISGASWMSSAAAGLAVVAAPLIIGALAESRTRDRFSGAAFATSNFAKDPTVTIGGAEYDPIKGILPDREALVGRALEAGISQDMIDRFKDKDRALLHYIRMLDANRQSGNEGPPINVNALLENDNMYAADWYRGQGYAHPQAMGWWNDKGYDLASNDPAITTASRAVATSIVGPLTEINRILGGAAEDFRVTAGYATRGEGKGVWAGLNISQGENNLVDWVDMDSFNSPQEAVKGMYEQAMGALEKLDLPGWAQEQVDGAQAAMAALSGDKMGEEAAALYAQTAGSIAQTISAIKMLIEVFPDFTNATQDSVYALAELMGGMDNLQSAYSTYIGAFWTEGERQALTIAQLTAQLAELGQTMPTTAEGFRRMVEDALAAGESGNALAAALLGMSGAMAQVLGQAQAVTFGASQELAGAIQAGLLGTFDGENLGAFMAQTVSDGIYNAIASGFAAQITDIIVQGVVNPVIQAALTGSSVSAAVSAASIESMVAQAQAVAQAAATVLNDPAIRAAIGSIASAVASINVPAMSAAPRYVSSYTDAVRDSGRAADEAAREAERLADAWRSIGDTLIDEVNRIRGVVADAGGDSLSYYQSLFAMDTAAARAGDQEAAGRLTELSGSLLRAAEAQAGSLFELQQMRAWVAQSLQDTAGYAYGKAGVTVTTPAPVPAPFPAPFPAMFGPRTAQQDNSTRELNQQITVLTEQNQRQAAQLADLQLQLLRVFRRWDDEGMPPQREDEGVTP